MNHTNRAEHPKNQLTNTTLLENDMPCGVDIIYASTRPAKSMLGCEFK
jgi:hypothetical protein